MRGGYEVIYGVPTSKIKIYYLGKFLSFNKAWWDGAIQWEDCDREMGHVDLRQVPKNLRRFCILMFRELTISDGQNIVGFHVRYLDLDYIESRATGSKAKKNWNRLISEGMIKSSVEPKLIITRYWM